MQSAAKILHTVGAAPHAAMRCVSGVHRYNGTLVIRLVNPVRLSMVVALSAVLTCSPSTAESRLIEQSLTSH